jgi:hypothetical protein
MITKIRPNITRWGFLFFAAEKEEAKPKTANATEGDKQS